MTIWNDIIRVAAANGLWAMLFVGLLIYQLQDGRKREIKYQETIERLSKNLKVINEVNAGVKNLNERLIKDRFVARCK